ncbi:hypothetical protein N9969_03455, partial [Akkermansiaceae bacterium]|nr:hypothetical protein [Akkermansiaceae bacterium]
MLLDLDPQALRGLSPASRLAFLKEKISGADQVLHERHLASESGLKNAQARSEMIDELIRALYET